MDADLPRPRGARAGRRGRRRQPPGAARPDGARRARSSSFPEDVGLVAGLIGSRGAAARAADDRRRRDRRLARHLRPQRRATTTAKFPGQPPSAISSRATDTFYRAFYETFRDLALDLRRLRRGQRQRRRRRAASRPPTSRRSSRCCAIRTSPTAPTPTRRSSAGRSTRSSSSRPTARCWCRDGQGGTRRSPSETDGVLRGSPRQGVPDADRAGPARGLSLRRRARPRRARHARRPPRRR